MNEFFDLVIIGAGPAGMAAAITSTGLGLNVAVIDEQSNPGGQIYRAIESVSYERPALMKSLGDDYAAGLKLVQRFRASGANSSPKRVSGRSMATAMCSHEPRAEPRALQRDRF